MISSLIFKKMQTTKSNNFIGHNIIFCTPIPNKPIQHPLYVISNSIFVYF
jgi:hypothetical protein